MANLLTGFTNRTVTNLQLNAGVLVTSYVKGEAITEQQIIGATRGGGSFTAVPTIHNVAVDGVPTHVKGLERIDEWVITLNTTLVEFNKEAIKIALGGGVQSTTEVGGDTIYKCNNDIIAGDYQDIYWIGNTSNGTNVVIKINNALNLTGFNLTISDKGEGTYPLALVGHYDATDLNTAPFSITFEVGA